MTPWRSASGSVGHASTMVSKSSESASSSEVATDSALAHAAIRDLNLGTRKDATRLENQRILAEELCLTFEGHVEMLKS